MPNPTVTSVVRCTSLRTLERFFASIEPDQIYDLELAPFLRSPAMGRPDADLGEAFHAALASGIRGQWVEHAFYPYVRVIRDWLTDDGVTRFYSEWEFRYARIPGKCDLLVTGGPNCRGVVEVKLVNHLPETAPTDDACQLALYVRDAADRYHDYHRFWGAIAYVAPSERAVRVFQWESMEESCRAAAKILSAA
jgi:hypothetical protein